MLDLWPCSQRDPTVSKLPCAYCTLRLDEKRRTTYTSASGVELTFDNRSHGAIFS
jgi:hypothetical protein